MAENSEVTCREIAGYIAGQLGMIVEFVDNVPWQERERLFDRGDIQVLWICGLPYVRKSDLGEPPLELLAAPVAEGDRYENKPVYFSDVVVHRDSRFRSFADLRGGSWAYNESRSHSGYNLVCHFLASLGESAGYFGRVVESGAHQASLRMIMDGEVDGCAIDSTVLELEMLRRPEIADQIAIIETLGPSPMPPWVAHKSLPPAVRSALRASLLSMHLDPVGDRVLAEARISRFAAVEDRSYDPIRLMDNQSESVRL
jgi:phosphonate transport system substrate-binding protein